MRLVFFGLSIASSWGNGHATTYRGLIRELHRRGHHVVFYERRTSWFDDNCDLPHADYCDIRRYDAWPPRNVAGEEDVEQVVAGADVVVLGSFTGAGSGDGIAIADWLPGKTHGVLAYYDIDTPVTLERFRTTGRTDYLFPRQLRHFDVVLSFAGGPVLDELRALGARRAEPFYCAIDPALHHPAPPRGRFACDLGYMGTYAAERQDMVDELFLAPARLRPEQRFVLGGPQYPEPDGGWPPNVHRYEHVAPHDHPAFYSSAAWQVKALRIPMRQMGWAPSVTLFEVAACGVPLISDRWPGIEAFFAPGTEALVADTREDVLAAFDLPESQRMAIGAAGLARVLREHTYVQRVGQLEAVLASLGAAPGGAAPL
jgi:spore maturation protein CgeB